MRPEMAEREIKFADKSHARFFDKRSRSCGIRVYSRLEKRGFGQRECTLLFISPAGSVTTDIV
jgi:hypothetical protein